MLSKVCYEENWIGTEIDAITALCGKMRKCDNLRLFERCVYPGVKISFV